jgi:hypothetical protein
MRRYKGSLAVAPVDLPSGFKRAPSEHGSGRFRTKVPPDSRKWPSGVRQMAGWHIAKPFRKDQTTGWECSAASRRCDKGEPVVRRGRKATGLSETAGLPNRGSECAANSAFYW